VKFAAPPSVPMSDAVAIEVSPGELIDKLTILEIKLDRIRDAQKLRNVEIEHAAVRSAYEATFPLPRARLPRRRTPRGESFAFGRSRMTFAHARGDRSSGPRSRCSRDRFI
jgi:hypothetical protein